MKTEIVKITMPEDCNVILGQAHFIKTAEDLYECLVNNCPNVDFGLAFSEASMDRLIRCEGNDDTLTRQAADTLMALGCGHLFIIYLKNAFPLNFLPAIKNTPEVVRLFCATANPVEAIVARTEQGGALLGVADGFSPLGIEDEDAKMKRKKFLRAIGYKL